MTHEGPPFIDEISIRRHRRNNKEGFEAFANGKLFWQASLEQCSSRKMARQLASVEYGRRCLLKDINDVLVWLLDEDPDYSGDLFVDRHSHQRSTKTVSCAVIYHDDTEFRKHLTQRAEAAFVALGWVFSADGWSELEWLGSGPVDELSAHERLRAIGRVRDAMSVFGENYEANQTCAVK